MDPSVLVLDEPTDSLDPVGVKEFYEGVRNYSRQKGTTILMAAHSVPEEIRFVDHFSYLEKGSIRSSGPPGSVLSGQSGIPPERYLPDHLLLQNLLSGMGIGIGPVELDPFRLEKRLKEMIKGSPMSNV
jgi:ABC-type multidrug transport system ATPase subunit